MKTKNEIGLVVLGASGYMAENALKILPKLRATLEPRGIDLALVCAAEANAEKRAELPAKIRSIVGYSCEVCARLSDAIDTHPGKIGPALRWLRGGFNFRRKLIIYDATPATHHGVHLTTVLRHIDAGAILYFGEKPLFTTLTLVQSVRKEFSTETFFCELIDTENPAFTAAKNFIDSKGIIIQQMSFWRTSCTGVSIAAGDGRGGVEGGALLDKAPHDLSVSLGLLGSSSVKRWSIQKVRTHLLALHENTFLTGQRSFLSVANKPLEHVGFRPRIQEQEPADALISFEVELTREKNVTISAGYIAGWVGVQNTLPELILSEHLNGLGVGQSEWLDSEKRKVSKNSKFSYDRHEVRVGVIEGMLNKRKVHLVLNLLPKFGKRRFVYLIGGNKSRKVIFQEEEGGNYEEKKELDLLAVFSRVAEHCAEMSVAQNLATESALLVHEIMLSVHAKASHQLREIDPDRAHKASLQAYRKYLLALEPE